MRLLSAGSTQDVATRLAREGNPATESPRRHLENHTGAVEAWIRATTSYADKISTSLGENPDRPQVVNSAAAGVDWCRTYLDEARMLVWGRAILAPETWPTILIERERQARIDSQTRLRTAAVGAARKLGLPLEEMIFVVRDLPLAVARPYLETGQVPPLRADDIVRALATRILQP